MGLLVAAIAVSAVAFVGGSETNDIAGVANVPLPPGASPARAFSSDRANLEYERYELPESATVRDTRRWYANQAIVGRTYRRRWQWCKQESRSAVGRYAIEYLWLDEKRDRLLSVVIERDFDDFSRGTDSYGRVTVSIAAEDDGVYKRDESASCQGR
jgi:hypothetical protein